MILEIFWTLSLKAHNWSSWILTECNLSWKTVKYCILSEVCMINSTVIFLDFHQTGTAIGWLLVTWPWLKSNVSRSWYIKQCTPLGLRYSTWSKHGRKWRDRRREKYCQVLPVFFPVNEHNNANTQPQAKKQRFFQLSQKFPEEKQQLVEEKDADNIRKVLCKSFIQWFGELNLCCYKYRVDCFGSLRLTSLVAVEVKV